jgi:tetratricopeptide (TPR) repeat protein
VWLGGKRGIDVREPARALALKAIELDESVALAYTVLGHIYQYFDYAPFEAQRAHLRAMELDDQDVSVLRAYSFFLLHHSAFDEALDVHRRELALYPASPLTTRITAEMFYLARRYDECVAECRKAMTLEPRDGELMVSLTLGRCLEQQGKQREAVDAYETGRAARGDGALSERLRRAYERGGWKEYWLARTSEEVQKHRGVGAAAVYARVGDVDEAMRNLELGADNRSLGGFANYPDFDPLRSDPRFQALLVRTGFSDDINVKLAAARAASRAAGR